MEDESSVQRSRKEIGPILEASYIFTEYYIFYGIEKEDSQSGRRRVHHPPSSHLQEKI
jgi:hypothetical protein